MYHLERLMSVQQAMKYIPLGKTKMVEVFHDIGAVTIGKKLMVTERQLALYVMRHQTQPDDETQPKRKKPRPKIDMDGLLDEFGRIPTRREMREKDKKKGATSNGKSGSGKG